MTGTHEQLRRAQRYYDRVAWAHGYPPTWRVVSVDYMPGPKAVLRARPSVGSEGREIIVFGLDAVLIHQGP